MPETIAPKGAATAGFFGCLGVLGVIVLMAALAFGADVAFKFHRQLAGDASAASAKDREHAVAVQEALASGNPCVQAFAQANIDYTGFGGIDLAEVRAPAKPYRQDAACAARMRRA